jgi:hypothetical protein
MMSDNMMSDNMMSDNMMSDSMMRDNMRDNMMRDNMMTQTDVHARQLKAKAKRRRPGMEGNTKTRAMHAGEGRRYCEMASVH